jgi:curved DNA-binding protein CbpA
MLFTDHYRILDLEPSASLPEIKKAYRRLALLYHPDKNNNDPYAAEQFKAIKEAYETLTIPSKKEKYLQQRWYFQSTGNRKTQGVITPVTILKQSLELDKYVSTLDIHRMDKQGLTDYILEITTDENIEKLNRFNDLVIHREITQTILHCSNPILPAQFNTVLKQLEKLNNDQLTKEKISSFREQHQQKHRIESNQIWLVLLIVVLLSLLIYLIS